MTFRTSLLVPLAAVSVAVLAGCGGDSGTVKPLSTAATAPPATTPAPQSASPTVQGTAPPAGSSTAGAAGTTPSEPIRVPVTLVFTRPNRVEPPTVTIPANVPIQLTLVSRDGRGHTLALSTGGRTYAVHAAAGGRASKRLPGLPAGRFPLSAVGAGPGATLNVGGQVGP